MATIKVTNGKETYEIPSIDLPNAQKDGFQVVKEPEKAGRLEAFGRGAAEGVSLGAGPEARAAAEYGIGKIGDLVRGREDYKDANIFKMIGEEDTAAKKAKKDRPNEYLGGEIIGGITTTAPLTAATGGLGEKILPKAAGFVEKGLRVGGKAAVQGLQGAFENALRGYNDEKDVSKEAAKGFGFGAGGELAGQSLKKIGSALENSASLQAFRMTKQKLSKAMSLKGTKDDLFDEVKRLGKTLRERNITNLPVSAKFMAEDAGKITDKTGALLEPLYKEADKTLGFAKKGGFLSKNQLKKYLVMKLEENSDIPDVQSVERVAKILDSVIKKTPGDKLNFSQLWEIRKNLNKKSKVFLREGQLPGGTISDWLNDAALSLQGGMNGFLKRFNPKVADDIIDTARLYNHLSTAELGLTREAFRGVSGSEKVNILDRLGRLADMTITSTPVRAVTSAATAGAGRAADISSYAPRYAGHGAYEE